MKHFAFTLVLTILSYFTYSQTNPVPYSLSGGDFTFTEWASTSATGTFPASMAFHFTNDPTSVSYDAYANGTEDYNCSYAATARCRFNGIDNGGISIIATSGAQYNDCISGTVSSTRFTGAAVVALDATGRQNIEVSFTGATLLAGDGTVPREFVLRLQYRYDGGSGFTAWQDVPGPVQYVSDTTGNAMPAELDNIGTIQLRWLYFQTALNSGGTRPRLRLDEITITSQASSSESVNVTGIVGSPFCITAITGGTGTVIYSATGTFNTTFRVKLSDASGSFATSQEIGIVSVNATNPTGTTNFTIPAGTATSSLYRIRIEADMPAVTGTQSAPLTIVNGVSMVDNLNVYACGSDADVSWTNPSVCFDEILIVLQENNPFTLSPTGDGTLYNADLNFGTGSSFENGYVVYKGSSSPQTITGIQGNSSYYMAVFSRNGTNWSNAAMLNFNTTVQPVTALTIISGDSQGTVSWTDPTYCFDEVMIIAKESTGVTSAPTGDGSTYTANPAFGLGSSFDGGFIMYKGTASPQIFTGFSNGTIYYISVFVRLTSEWSQVTEASFMPFGQPELQSYILPAYMQGKTPTNNQRVSLAFRALLANLSPDSTYRYYTRAVINTDSPTATGAGGCLFVSDTGFTRTTSPSMSTAGEYGEFTVNSSGVYEGWFILEPSGNARFTPGSYIFPRIFINNGSGGTAIIQRFTPADSVKVLGFDVIADANSGTGVIGITSFTPKNFVFLYDNISAAGRPLCGAHVEASGIDFPTTTVYVPFYNTQVYNISGNWGGIVPNINSNGIMAIQELSLLDGSLVGTYTSTNSIWFGTNTISPTGGADNPLVIDFTLSAGNAANTDGFFYVFDNNLYINNIGNRDASVYIYNVLGQIVYTKSVNGNNILSLDLPAGSYVCKIVTENNNETGRFIIQR